MVAKRLIENVAKRHTAVVGQTLRQDLCDTSHTEGAADRNIHTIFFDPKHDDGYADLGEICYTPMQFYARLSPRLPASSTAPALRKRSVSKS